MVQMTGKTNPGGLKAGLFNAAYVDIFPPINAETAPIARGIRIDMIKALLFWIFIQWHTSCLYLANYMHRGRGL